MDLLGANPILDLGDKKWRIYSRHSAEGPQFVGADACVENSYITEGCEIYGTVKNCVIGAGVKVAEGAVVCDSVLMGDTVIGAGATVNYSIIDTGVCIGAGATVGAPKADGVEIAVVGEDVVIDAGAVVPAGAMISEE